MTLRKITVREALREAMAEEMRANGATQRRIVAVQLHGCGQPTSTVPSMHLSSGRAVAPGRGPAWQVRVWLALSRSYAWSVPTTG